MCQQPSFEAKHQESSSIRANQSILKHPITGVGVSDLDYIYSFVRASCGLFGAVTDYVEAAHERRKQKISSQVSTSLYFYNDMDRVQTRYWEGKM